MSAEPTPSDRKRNKAYEKGYESGRADERRYILSTIKEKFPDYVYDILYQEFQPCPECGSQKFIVRQNGEDECPECPYVEDVPNPPVDDVGDSSSPVSRSEDHNGEGAVQDAQLRVSGEPPKTSELPTAAEWKDVTEKSYDVKIKPGTELVRRSDVAQLIQDQIVKLEKRRERVYKYYQNDEDPLDWDDWHAEEDAIDAKIEELKGLLEEVQQD